MEGAECLYRDQLVRPYADAHSGSDVLLLRNANSNFTDPWWGNSRNFADAYRAATGTNATYIEASMSPTCATVCHCICCAFRDACA